MGWIVLYSGGGVVVVSEIRLYIVLLVMCALIPDVSFGQIYTPTGCEIHPDYITYYDPYEDDVLVQYWDDYFMDECDNLGMEGHYIVESSDAQFNCHAYAWYMYGADNPDKIWLSNDEYYWNEIWCDNISGDFVSSPEEGDVVEYVGHSAIYEGSGNHVISKLVHGPTMCHDMMDLTLMFGQIWFYFARGDIGASAINALRVEDGVVRWNVQRVEEEPLCYVVRARQSEDVDHWINIGVVEFRGLGEYSVGISDLGWSSVQLMEIEKDMSRSVLDECAARMDTAGYIDVESPTETELRKAIEELIPDEVSIRGGGKSIPVECVVYTASDFVVDVNEYLVPFWRDLHDVGISVVDVSVFGEGESEIRAGIKSDIVQNYGQGVDLFHLIGDASEYEEMLNAYEEHPWDTLPEHNIIPTYYFYDDPYLSYYRKYYYSDFPYSDVDDDGYPDAVVTRWTVNTVEGLLARIMKVIKYNRNRGAGGDLSNTRLLALLENTDRPQGGGGEEVEEIAARVLSCVPGGLDIEVTYGMKADYQNPSDTAESFAIWNDVQPEMIFMWSGHSTPTSPNYMLTRLNILYGLLDEVYPAMIFGANCHTAGFANDDPDGIEPCQELLAKMHDRGVIAWIGPVCASAQRINELVSAEFVQQLYGNPNWSMARAWLWAQREALLAAEHDDFGRRNIRNYVFLGDPLSRLAPARRDAAFINVTQEEYSGRHRVATAVEWVDYDSDGNEDLYLTFGDRTSPVTHNSSNILFQGDGSGGLTDVTPAGAENSIGWSGPTSSAAWGDYDNDGDQDLYLSNGDELTPDDHNVLLINSSTHGNPVFEQCETGDVNALEDDMPGGKADWVDIDNDGDLDLFVGRRDHVNLLFENAHIEDEYFLAPITVAGLTDVYDSGVGSWVDYDGDGLVDVFLHGSWFGESVFMKNEGGMVFTDVTVQVGMQDVALSQSISAAWGDYDNDGDVDIAVGMLSGEVVVMRNDDGVFSDVTEELGIAGSTASTSALAWCDYDNDCDIDLMVGQTSVGIFENMYPVEYFDFSSTCELPVDNELLSLNIGDYDRDGDYDPYVGVYDPLVGGDDHSLLYRNDIGDEYSWLGLDLHGNIANRDGVGATVRVFLENGVIQTRQLTGAIGGASHQGKTILFGMGANEEARKVRIEWPWGRVVEVPGVDAGQYVTVTDALPAAECGGIYLTTDSSGAQVSSPPAVSVEEWFDVYLAIDMSPAMQFCDAMQYFDVSIGYPDNLMIVNEELYYSGIDTDPDEYSYSITLDQCVDLSSAPIVLAKFTAIVVEEGADPEISIANSTCPAFTDPLEPTVPSWRDCESDVLYRFEEHAQTGDITIPIDDTKCPVLQYSGLWMDNRNMVLIEFDEPLAPIAADGLHINDISHYTVHKKDVPSVVIDLYSASVFGDRGVLLLLDAPIPETKEYDIEIRDMQDLHFNETGTIVAPVTRNDDGDDGRVKINESMSGGDKTAGEELLWVELTNDGVRGVCLNGWSVTVEGNVPIVLPDDPIMIMMPSEYAVIAAHEGLPVDITIDSIVYRSDSSFGEENGSILAIDPFGEIVDQVDTGGVSKGDQDGQYSIQRICDAVTGDCTWVADGPAYADGMFGTPGATNYIMDDGEGGQEIPDSVRSDLLQAIPNPFNPSTKIVAQLALPGHVRASIYDLKGRQVKTLYNSNVDEKGLFEMQWLGDNDVGELMPSGVYFVRMVAPDGKPRPLKITLMK